MPKALYLTIAIMALPVMHKIVDPQFCAAVQPAFDFKKPLLNNKAAFNKQGPEADTNALKNNGWYADAVKKLQQKEYEFNKEADSVTYSTPNRNNNLRFYYSRNGFTVQPRTTKIPMGKQDEPTMPDEIKYKTLPDWKITFTLDKKQIGEGIWQVAGNKAEYKTGNITVQYLNNEQGMRQNFIVRSPLSGDSSDLKLHFNIETALQQRLQNDRIQFLHKKSGVVLNYDQLKVWDANGQPLEASFEKSNRDYCIHVQTQHAVYPITIDPLSSTASSTLESNQASADLGFSVASAGDVNGDGYSDVVAGAYQYDNGQTDEGAAFIFHGSASGINATAAARLESNQAGAWFGYSVAGAGDANADGYNDVIVGAYLYDNGQTDEGAVFIYHGSASGINTTAAATIDRDQASASVGYSVAGAGDINGDGYSDILIGAPNYDNGQTDEGIVYTYYGSSSGINNAALISYYESNQIYALAGRSVAGAGDVNGDGYSDIIIGIPSGDNGEGDEGVALIYKGSATGLSGGATVLESNQSNAWFARSVACAGDVNGDGYSDVVIGCPNYDYSLANEGAAFIYHGSASGTSTTYAAMVRGNQITASMGTAVACAGDINGDGYSEVIVGANYYDKGETDEGAAWVYHGSPAGINTTAGASMENNQANAGAGFAVASAGDVNGDGYSDVIVGAYLYDNGQLNEGAAFVYHGSASGISTTAAATVESNVASAIFGYSVAAAGDVNGDGFADVIVGAFNYANGQSGEGAAFIYHGSSTGINTTAAARVESNQTYAAMGYSVANAGDVNADGYTDVIVGAYTYDNGQTDEGAAFVYYGSASGINTTVAATLESNQEFAMFGNSVAGAGDVNGDGYSDLIVGAYLYDNGQNSEGAAFVYHGSATGIGTAAAAMIESNQGSARLGSVASAGDVNGDGFSDIIIGAELYDNGETDEGVAFVYHGSASGISTSAAARIESNQASAGFGFSVAGAGDVNGDGYSDVIAGAYSFDNGQTDEGAAFIYHGSASGISTAAAARVESNQASSGFGLSVAGAGDVNGDGYSDVIVGAYSYDNGETNEGASFVYYGNTPYKGKQNNLDLYNTDLVTPVTRSNLSDNYCGAGLYAKSFLGTGKGKLVWEIKKSYSAWSGSPITNSVVYTSQQSGYTSLGTAGTTLKNLVLKQWGSRYTKIRARVKYNPATAITGQLYGPWRYVPDILSTASLGALPIDLISFKAEWLQAGKTAQLKFLTANESGICCYDIEKSSDGVNYTVIDRVEAKNTSGQNTYSTIDKNATGKKQYYRLKTNFNTGTAEYSNIQLLQTNAATEILVFPNPATNVLKLQLNNNYNNFNVQILNGAGQVLKQFNNLSAANQIITIPLSNLSAGTYFLYLQSNSQKQLLQFVKQ
jgi:hypothetical protein